MFKLADLTVKAEPWGNIANQRVFLDDLAKKLNIQRKEDWYKITGKILRDHGGYELVQMYNYSTHKLFSTVYPEYPLFLMKIMFLTPFSFKWRASKFVACPKTLNYVRHVPQRHWDDLDNQRAFMDEIAAKLDITASTAWYPIPSTAMKQYGGSSLLDKYNGSFGKLLATVYPEYKNACRAFVQDIVVDMKLNKVEEVMNVPIEYQKLNGR